MKRYESKIGWGLVFFIAGVIVSTSLVLIVNQVWVGLAINLALTGFIVHMFTTTYYVIEGDVLQVKCGFLINMRIAISSVCKITETSNPLGSPATSLDRVAIYYNKWDVVMISPKDKIDFIRHITEINSKIEVVLKKSKFASAV
jgi:hypothetical protein